MANRYSRPSLSRARRRASHRKHVIIGGGALAALLVVVLIVLILPKGSGHDRAVEAVAPTPTQAPTPTPPPTPHPLETPLQFGMQADIVADFPQNILDPFGIGQLHIVEPLIGQKIGHQFHVALRNTTRNQLIQHDGHLLLGKGSALQKDLAKRQDLTIGHKGRRISLHEESLLLSVINHLTAVTGILYGSVIQEGPDVIDIPLAGSLIHAKTLSFLWFLNHFTLTQPFIHV